jgi:hypothetical protein
MYEKIGLRSGGRRGENYRSPWSSFRFSTPVRTGGSASLTKLLLFYLPVVYVAGLSAFCIERSMFNRCRRVRGSTFHFSLVHNCKINTSNRYLPSVFRHLLLKSSVPSQLGVLAGDKNPQKRKGLRKSRSPPLWFILRCVISASRRRHTGLSCPDRPGIRPSVLP